MQKRIHQANVCASRTRIYRKVRWRNKLIRHVSLKYFLSLYNTYILSTVQIKKSFLGAVKLVGEDDPIPDK